MIRCDELINKLVKIYFNTDNYNKKYKYIININL